MFNKKYSPVVLTKASMLVFHLVESRLRFVLQDEMIRIFQMTMDDTKFTEYNPLGGDFQYHKSDVALSVLCRNGKLVVVEAEIRLMKCNDGEFVIASGIESERLSFPGCKSLQGAYIYFGSNPRTREIYRCTLWYVNVSNAECESPDDPIMQNVRKMLLA